MNPSLWFIRISSAASEADALSENPRSPTSNCMELTPKSKSTPSIRVISRRASSASSVRKFACTSSKRESFGRSLRAWTVVSDVERDDPSARPEPIQDRLRMTARTERCIDVRPAALDRKPVDCFL